MQPADSPLQALGFPALTEVAGLKSVAHLFGTTKRRCGIYALALPRNRFYLGQAVDVVRRFAQHAKAHEQIIGFSFLPVPRTKLDQRERDLIFAAERAGLTLMNVVHVTDVEGETDLDALLSQAKVEAWLADPYAENANDFETTPVTLSGGHVARTEPNFLRFKEHPLCWPSSILLFLYLESAIPYPRTTEYSFWSVSCMPSTNQGTSPRTLCVSCSVMEVFVVGSYRDPKFTGFGWAFVNVASDILFEAYGNERAFRDAHPEVEVQEAAYRDAGQHCIRITAPLLEDMLSLLDDPAVTRAAATLCLRLMRKRATIYSKFHCPQLVDHALSFRAVTDEELDTLIAAAFPSEEEEAAMPKEADSNSHRVPKRGDA